MTVAGRVVTVSGTSYPSDLTDEQWGLLGWRERPEHPPPTTS